MAVQHSISARNALANAVVALIDQGSLYATGRVVIFDSNNNVISTLPFSVPAFAAAVNGTCTANSMSNDFSPVPGVTPSRFEAQDRNGNYVFRGTCSPTGDLGDNGQAIPPSTPTSVTGLFYEAPP